MTGYPFDRDDVAYLRSPAGRAALAETARRELSATTRLADVAAVRADHGGRAAALIETVLLRRRAAAKLAELPGSAEWLFTDEALQQASAAAVARHRAERLAGRVVHDVTCSIGTELAALRATAAGLLGSDLDPVRLAMADHNLAGALPLCRADALRPVSAAPVIVADPARRSGGRRRFDPRDYRPALDGLLQTYRDRDLVVKVAPGIDFAALGRLGFRGEITVTSLFGSVREACLWSPGLATVGVRRRAVLLDRGEELTDADPDDCPVGAAGRYLIDPDGAVVRAGLVRHYGARHHLWQLDPAIAYLTGDTVPDGTRGFEVLDQLAYKDKALRAALAARDCGAVEILVRGVDVDPDALRRRLRSGLRGSTPLSVILTRIGAGAAAKATAFVCRATRGPGGRPVG